MGISDRARASYREAKADALRLAHEAVPASMRLTAEDFTTRPDDGPTRAAPGQPVADDRPGEAARPGNE